LIHNLYRQICSTKVRKCCWSWPWRILYVTAVFKHKRTIFSSIFSLTLSKLVCPDGQSVYVYKLDQFGQFNESIPYSTICIVKFCLISVCTFYSIFHYLYIWISDDDAASLREIDQKYFKFTDNPNIFWLDWLTTKLFLEVFWHVCYVTYHATIIIGFSLYVFVMVVDRKNYIWKLCGYHTTKNCCTLVCLWCCVYIVKFSSSLLIIIFRKNVFS
jgi:hypothetical protein